MAIAARILPAWIDRRIGRKLVLALAPIAVVVIATAGFLADGASRIKRDLTDIVERAQPLSAAAFELVINVNGTTLGVTKYLRRVDPSFRQRFLKDGEDFRRFHRLFMQRATIAETRRLGEEAGRLYEDFARIGTELLELKDRQRARFTSLTDLSAKLDAIIELRPDSSPREKATAGDETIAEITGHLAETVLWLAVFIGSSDTQSLRRFRLAHEETQMLVEQSRTPLTAGSPDQRLDRFIKVTDALLETTSNVIDLDREIQLRFGDFVALRRQIDDILDDKIQVRVRGALDTANEKATRTVTDGYLVLGLAFAIIVLFALLAFRLVRTGLLARIGTLMSDIRRIEAGDLDHRLRPNGADEIAELGGALDGMLTRLARARQELKDINDNLENLVRERTENMSALNRQLEDELSHRQNIEAELLLARDAAEASNRAKGQFLANMSHELRTPLNAIIGFAEIMRSQILGPLDHPQYLSYAGDILDSGTHLLTIINDILDLAKIETGKLTLDESLVDCRGLVDNSVRFFRLEATGTHARIAVEDNVGRCAIRVDVTKMKRALINLLSNALKFTPEDGRVTIAIDRTAGGGVAFSVADTGIGIPADKFETVLSPFGQVEGALHRKFEGTGLGLPLAKSLIEMHGGEFNLASTVGKGTTITLTLPPARLADGFRGTEERRRRPA